MIRLLESASTVVLLLLMLGMLVAESQADIMIERRDGASPDRFTISSKICQSTTDCTAYGGVREGESNCHCKCTVSMNTFSAGSQSCIKQVDECSELMFDSTAGKLFTFSLVDSQLYPQLPVTQVPSIPSQELACDTENLEVRYQTQQIWKLLKSEVFTLSSDPTTNNTYLQLQVDAEAVRVLEGKLIYVRYACRNLSSNIDVIDRCLAFKLQGFQKVSVDESNVLGQSTTDTVKKLNVAVFYWVVGGCIAALVLAATIGLTIACTYRAKQREKQMRVHRLDSNGNYIGDDMNPSRKDLQISTDPNGRAPKPTANGKSRKPMYKKNPNRNNYPQVTPVSPRRSDREQRDDLDGRVTPRTSGRSPRPASQNSATFIVNENEPTTRRSPTDADSVNVSLKYTQYSSVIRKPKDPKEEKQAIRAAQSVLTEFEGSRLTSIKSTQNELFNPRYQSLAGMHASIRGMTQPEPPSKTRSKKKSKDKLDDLDSKWSINYDEFHIPEDSSPSSSGVETSNSQNSESDKRTNPPEEVLQSGENSSDTGQHSQTSSTQSLREFDVDDSFLMHSDEFQQTISAKGESMKSIENDDNHESSDGEGTPNESRSHSSLTSIPSVIVTFHKNSSHDTDKTVEEIAKPDDIESSLKSSSPTNDDHATSSSYTARLKEEPTTLSDSEKDNELPVTNIDDIPFTNIDDLMDTTEFPPPPDDLVNSSYTENLI